MLTRPEAAACGAPPGRTGWAYFLDVDGTLINRTDNIGDVFVTAELRAILQRLMQACQGAVALVSGRRLADLQALFDLPGLMLAGQNGLEGTGPAGEWRLSGFPQPVHQRISSRLRDMLRAYPQLLLEDKGLMMTLHCRTMSMPYFQKALLPAITRLARHSGTPRTAAVLGVGKSGMDLMPGAPGKGQAVRRLMGKAPFSGRLPVFIGDDWADESAFEEVNRRGGCSIKVGPQASCALHRLQDVPQVLDWLSAVTR